MAEGGPSSAVSISSISESGDEHPDPGTAMSQKEFRRRRTAIIEAWRRGLSQKQVIHFFGFPKSTVARIFKRLKQGTDIDVVEAGGQKRRRERRVRTPQFLAQVEAAIEDAPDTSIRSLAARFNSSYNVMWKAIHEDLGCKSYKLRLRQKLTNRNREERLKRATNLLKELRFNTERAKLRFFSDEKIFTVEEAHNHQNNRWIAANPDNIPVVERGKFPRSCHVLGVVSSEGDAMPPHFFERGQGITAEVYRNVLRDVVVPWMSAIANGRPYVFQQDGAPAHTSNLVQEWLATNVSSFWPKGLWPPNSPDLNPLDYYVWNNIVIRSNQRSHDNVESLKEAIKEAFSTIPRGELKAACRSFRKRLELVIANNGGWFE